MRIPVCSGVGTISPSLSRPASGPRQSSQPELPAQPRIEAGDVGLQAGDGVVFDARGQGTHHRAGVALALSRGMGGDRVHIGGFQPRMALRLQPAGGGNRVADQFVAPEGQKVTPTGRDIGEEILKVLLLVGGDADADDLRPQCRGEFFGCCPLHRKFRALVIVSANLC